MKFGNVNEYQEWIEYLNESRMLCAYSFATVVEFPLTSRRLLHRLVYNYCPHGCEIDAFDTKSSKLKVFKSYGVLSDLEPLFEIDVPE